MKKSEILKRLKEVATNKLDKKVLRNIMDNLDSYDGVFENLMKDYSHGCNTGIVGSLISYKDTNKFFDSCRKDIIKVANEMILEGIIEVKEGCKNSGEYYNYIEILNVEFELSVYRFLKNRFNMYQKNNLAWLAFENSVYKFNSLLEEIL
jgi:hypothetical protein